MKKKLVWFGLIICLVLTGLGTLIGYFYSEYKVANDLKLLEAKTDEIFEGKTEITDGCRYKLEGLFLDNQKRTYTLLNSFTQPTGFEIFQLSKADNGFVKSYWTPDNLNYLEDEYSTDPVYGFRTNNYRLSPNECYNRLYDMLTLGNERVGINKSYTSNKYAALKNFPIGFSSKFFSVSKKSHPIEGYVTFSDKGQAGTPQYSINFIKTKEYFAYEKNLDEIKNFKLVSLTRFSIYGIVLGILITLLLTIIMPSTGKAKQIFNKKWKNIANNIIIEIKPNLLGRIKVTSVMNSKVTKGFAKISNKGENIQITFHDSEYFYKLISISEYNLDLENLADNLVEKFELLGHFSDKTTESHTTIDDNSVI